MAENKELFRRLTRIAEEEVYQHAMKVSEERKKGIDSNMPEKSSTNRGGRKNKVKNISTPEEIFASFKTAAKNDTMMLVKCETHEDEILDVICLVVIEQKSADLPVQFNLIPVAIIDSKLATKLKAPNYEINKK